jgi:hypothetical protein
MEHSILNYRGSRPKNLSQLDLNKLREACAANVQMITIMPSFQFDNINWDAVGDTPAALDALLRCFNLSHKAVISESVLPLAEWQQTKNSGV